MTRPKAGDQRCGELGAGDHADDEGAKAEPLMHLQRHDRHGDADDEIGDEHGRDDRQKRHENARGAQRGTDYGHCGHRIHGGARIIGHSNAVSRLT